MILRHRWLAILLAATACATAMYPGQRAESRKALSRPCRTPDSVTWAHLHRLRTHAISMSPDDVRWRAPAIPHITDTTAKITVVSDAAVCRRALRFYRREMPADSAVSEIEVIRVDTVFVISNPGYRPPGAEWIGRFVVDSAMRFLQAYLYG